MNTIDLLKISNAFGDSRTVEDAKNPRYMNTYFNSILLDVKFKEFNDYVSFTAMPTDSEPWGRQLFADAEAGKYGRVKPPKPAPRPSNDPESELQASVASAKILHLANQKLRENSHLLNPAIQELLEPESAEAVKKYIRRLGEIIATAQQAVDDKKRYLIDLPELHVKFKTGA